MTLEELKLPPFVIQNLYHNSLVDLGKERSVQVKTSGEINYFGGFKQRIVLIVNNPDNAFVSDQELSFLSGILNACKLTLEDIGIVNISGRELTYQQISDNFKPLIVMMFGIAPQSIQLPFVMPEFQRQSYNNQVYLSAPSLAEIENNKDLKRKLWIVLQQIFSL